MSLFNKIHYAIEITTDYASTIPEIGMDTAGVIRYVTDGYDTLNATYEDATPVTESWNTTLLSKNGIKPSSQNIDIITGGDYAFAGNLDIALLNVDKIHKTFNETPDLYVGGAKIKMFVIVNDVMYQRWEGVVTGNTFNETSYTLNCKDKNNTDNNVLKDYLFGVNESKLALVEVSELSIDDVFVKNVVPETINDRTVVPYGNDSYPSDSDTFSSPDYMRYVYNGGSARTLKYIPSRDDKYEIYLNGRNENAIKGRVIEFGDDEPQAILDVRYDTLLFGTDEVDYTIILVDTRPQSMTDFSQFYGKQPNGTDGTIISSSSVADEETVVMKIYENANVFSLPEGVEPVTNEDGKLVFVDADGNEVLLDDNRDANGNIIVPTTNTYETVTPIRISHGEIDDGLLEDIESGGAKNLEQFLTGTSIPNDANPFGTYNEFVAKRHGFLLEFDGEDVGFDTFNLFPIINSAIYGSETWTSPQGNIAPSDNWYASFIDLFSDISGYSDSKEFLAQKFDSFYIDVYSVVDSDDYGLVANSAKYSITLPNTMSTTNVETIPTADPAISYWRYTQSSTPATNAPLDILKIDTTQDESFILDQPNLIEYRGIDRSFDIDDGNQIFPYGIIDDSKLKRENGSESTITGNKVFVIIGKQNQQGDWKCNLRGNIDQDKYEPQSVKKFRLGVNTLGLYRETSSDVELFLKTRPTDGDVTKATYPYVLGELSGSTSVLPKRDTWYVGGEVEEENTFKVVTKLCKQGFVGGFTARDGEIILRDWMTQSTDVRRIDTTKSLVNTITNYKLSDISKAYNDFTIKFHKIDNEYQREITVTKVDEDSFPEPTPDIPIWSDDILPPSLWEVQLPTADQSTGLLRINFGEGEEPGDIIKLNVNSGEIVGENFTLVAIVGLKAIFQFDVVSYTAIPDDVFVPVNNYNLVEGFTEPEWKSYVSGLPSTLYSEAKELWEYAHASYLLNKRVRKSPTDRTTLEYAKNLSLFEKGEYAYDEDEYGEAYTKLFAMWSTRQKYQVNNVQLPITETTIQYELLDDVEFFDPLILSEDEIGKGWITSIVLDPTNNLIKLQITFDLNFIAKPLLIGTGDVIESGTTQYDVVESGDTPHDIVEGQSV